MQAQDPRGARLAIRARTAGLTAADVDRAFGDGTLIIAWLNRGTLHLVRREDFHLLHALTTPQLRTGSDRRLAQEGVTPGALEKALRLIATAIAADGPQTREELRDRLRRARVPTAGQALIHVLFRAGIEGHVVRGPMRGRQHCYVLAEEWLGPPPELDPDRTVAEVARRYLVARPGAGDRDFAKWAGIPLTAARRGLAGVRAPTPPAEAPPVPAVKLLGAFDEVLMGWADRSWVLPAPVQPAIVSGGIFRPSVLARGRIVAPWRWERGRVELDGAAPRGLARALRDEAADVERFLRSAR